MGVMLTAEAVKRAADRIHNARLAIVANERAKAHYTSTILIRHCDQRIAAARAELAEALAEGEAILAIADGR
jgi:hypothetical protein